MWNFKSEQVLRNFLNFSWETKILYNKNFVQ